VLRADRLQALVDATVATIATINMGPIARLETSFSAMSAGNCNLACYFSSRGITLAVYFLGFFLVSSVWVAIVRLFRSIRHTDDVLLCLVSITLVVLAFLPLSISLLAFYPGESLAVYLTSLVIGGVSIMILIMIWYAFRRAGTELLHDDVDLSFTPKALVLIEVLKILICVVAALVNIHSQDAAIVITVFISLVPLAVKVLESIRKQSRDMKLLPRDYFSDIVKKDRLEAYSDGVFAITATLIILDVSTEIIPSKLEVSENGFDKSLRKYWPSLVAFIISFVMISLLWFVHHSVFHALQRVNVLLYFVNLVSLSIVGIIPLTSKLLLLHGSNADANDNGAVQFACLVLFGCSISHFMMFTIAVWNRENLLKPLVNSQTSSEVYIAMKTLIVPLVSLVILFITYAGEQSSYVVFTVSLTLVPVLFALLNWISSRIRYQRSELLEPSTEISETTSPM
jgi:uncharacterized membrane protein